MNHATALLDTSVVIAADTGLVLPESAAISVATIAELHFGVHLALDARARAHRITRLAAIEATFDPLPIDDRVARAYGSLAALTHTAGRRARHRTMDLLIAATAVVYGVALYTRDRRDFEAVAGEVELVIV